MTGRTATTSVLPYGCPQCAIGYHTGCSRGSLCACSGRGHVPDVDTAAAMCSYLRPDLAKLPVEQRATHWRRSTEKGRR